MSVLSRGLARKVAVACSVVALVCGCSWIVPGAVAATPGRSPDWHHLEDHLYEATYTLVTGPGPYDRIRLHRITQARNGAPRPTNKSVLLLHGDAWGFDAAFMRASSSTRSLPGFLARRGVDVWGIDLAWTLVPSSVENLDFMSDWGLQHDIADVRRALAFARGVRAQTGSGHGALALGAWSRGAWIAYSLLGQESQLPVSKRQAGSFISMDNFYKTDDENARQAHCQAAASDDAALAQHEYAADGRAFADIGRLAQTDPDAISPYFGAPYTNAGASLSLGAAGFQGGSAFSPWYHFVGGTFPHADPSMDPNGLRFTRFAAWNRFLRAASPFEPLRLLADAAHITCDDGTTRRFDAHLGDIRVPILYVGAAGGFGTYGLHSMRLTASTDTRSVVARAFPKGQEKRDIGHVDLFYAKHAARHTWGSIATWLHEHPTNR
jgi:hypothetical protein